MLFNNLESGTLDCLHSTDRHTGENVSGVFEDFAKEWKLTDKTNSAHTVVVVNGKASSDTRWIFNTSSYQNCILPTLHLILMTGSICTFSSREMQASSLDISNKRLENHLNKCMQTSAIFHKLQQDVSTWWQDKYSMMARPLEVTDAIQSIIPTPPLKKTTLQEQSCSVLTPKKFGKYMSALKVQDMAALSTLRIPTALDPWFKS